MPRRTRIFSALMAVAIFVATIYCGCAAMAAPVAAATPSESSCCKHPSESSDHPDRAPRSHSDGDCPHCHQSLVSAAPTVHTAITDLPAASFWSLLPLAPPLTPLESFVRPAGASLATFERTAALPLRLHCALTL